MLRLKETTVNPIDNTKIKLDLANAEISCFGANDGTIKLANLTGGSGPYTYTVTGVSVTFGPKTQDTSKFTDLEPGTYNYKVTTDKYFMKMKYHLLSFLK